jgi:hypothetical protein
MSILTRRGPRHGQDVASKPLVSSIARHAIAPAGSRVDGWPSASEPLWTSYAALAEPKDVRL